MMAGEIPTSTPQLYSEPWSLIESDPGVFTLLLEALGVKDTQIEEIYSLDNDSFKELEPVYGLIFLFKWRKSEGDDDEFEPFDNNKIYFANQVIENACATQAILSIVLNCEKLSLGPELQAYQEFTRDFLPPLKGLALTNSKELQSIHNSFSSIREVYNMKYHQYQEPLAENEDIVETEDVYHFSSYVKVGNFVYELDGLKNGPIKLGECGEAEHWLDIARPAIQERIDKYAKSEIRFNLMALIKDRRKLYAEKLDESTRFDNIMKQHFPVNDNTPFEGNVGNNDTLKSLDALLMECNDEQDIIQKLENLKEEDALIFSQQIKILQENLKKKMKMEQEKYERYKMEQQRRRHDYRPFIERYLSIMSTKDDFKDILKNSTL